MLLLSCQQVFRLSYSVIISLFLNFCRVVTLKFCLLFEMTYHFAGRIFLSDVVFSVRVVCTYARTNIGMLTSDILDFLKRFYHHIVFL